MGKFPERDRKIEKLDYLTVVFFDFFEQIMIYFIIAINLHVLVLSKAVDSKFNDQKSQLMQF